MMTLALLAVGLLAWPGQGSAQTGLVRIFNAASVPVVVYVQNVDFYGYRRWVALGTVAPRATQEFPAVPPGAVFGAKSVDGSRQWKPFTVVYPTGAPIFQYTLYP